MRQPLDRGLNAAILSIAHQLFPTGYDISEQAPSTYEDLVAHLNSGNRMVVFSGGCEKTIYADREVNYAFRAWHDWCHWRGQHNFSLEGEVAVWEMQCRHIVTRYGISNTQMRWIFILHAEVVGQRIYYEKHRAYIDNQYAFVASYPGVSVDKRRTPVH